MKSMEAGRTPETKLTQNVEVSTLCAFYGGLLTERQRTALQLHYDEDWSMAEIADYFQVSRQNVHDLIVRSVQKLARYEQAVGGVAQAQRMSKRLHQAVSGLSATQAAGEENPRISEVLEYLQQLIEDIEGKE